MEEGAVQKERAAKWDNLKFYLIALVVIGHVVFNYLDYSETAKAVYLFIYSFHMPAFVFVAGLFSKHAVEQRRYETVVEFVVIYLVMKFLDAAGDAITGSRIDFHFLWESGPAWFALAMAVFLAATMFLHRFDLRYIMAAAVFVGCIAGLDTHFGDHFASMRICTFYPVFLAGFWMEHQKIAEFQRAHGGLLLKAGGLLVLAGDLALCLAKTDALYPLLRLFKGKYEYAEMDMGIEGVLFRLVCYAFWALMIAAVVFAAGDRRMLHTWLGSRTMASFIWHPIAIAVIFRALHMTTWLTIHAPHTYLAAAVCIAFLITIGTAYLSEFRIGRKLRR